MLNYQILLIGRWLNCCIVFMESAGKRHGTDGADRGKRKLEEQEEDSGEESSKKPKLDRSKSDSSTQSSSESGGDSPQASQSQSAPSQPSQPQAGPSQAGTPQAGPSRPTTMGPPPHPLGDSPPSLTSGEESATEADIPEGAGASLPIAPSEDGN